MRGGEQGNVAEFCRVAFRHKYYPSLLHKSVGFRPVRSNLSFALIPGGTFTMGDPLDGLADAPPHPVNVSTFYMQKLGVTKADWDAVRAWGLTNGYTDLAAGAGKAADHPVQTVSWFDAVKWCNARSEKEGLTPCYYTDAAQTAVNRTGNSDIANTMVSWTANGYRLPTEAEREKAARGGLSGKRYPLGDSITTTDANFSSAGTTAVGSYASSGYGLNDMAGNIWEWCWDWYSGSFYGTPDSLTNPAGPSGTTRVIRGGVWIGNASHCRVAYRYSYDPGEAIYAIGFRSVRANIEISPPSLNTPVDTRDWVNLTIIANGTTDPSVGEHQYRRDSAITVTALTPKDGYLPFSKWTGDATGTTNPLTVTMDADKTITAVFPQDTSDSDADGLTYYEEVVLYHTDPTKWDTDGDGYGDGYEVKHGANPNDATDFPRAKLTIFTAVEVRLESELGQFYRIESSTDLKIWMPVEEHIAGTGGEITKFYSIQEIPKRYFRAMPEPQAPPAGK